MRNICEVMQKHGITDADSTEGINLCLHCPEPICLWEVERKGFNSRMQSARALEIANSGVGIAGIAKEMHRSKRQVLRYLEVSNA